MVPLVASASTTCPYCRAVVEVPQAYHQHKAALEALAQSQASARDLYEALGQAPSRLFRAFAFFDSVWFWALGLGFWLTFAMFAMVYVVPWVGRVVFAVNTADVMSARQQTMLTLGGSLGSVVFGLLLSAWGRQRAIRRGGLQAALAAKAPAAAGGPARCRSCGAALAFTEGSLGARCDYCSADNLLMIPKTWAGRMAKLRRSIGSEVDAALKAWQLERSRLWSSLLTRLALGAALVGLPVLLVGSADDQYDPTGGDPAKAPVNLPKWEATLQTSACDTANNRVQASAVCGEGRCEGYRLVGAKPGLIEVLTEALPVGTAVHLDLHEQAFTSDDWVEVASSTQTPRAYLKAPLNAWYRLRFDLEAAPDSWWPICMRWEAR